MLTLLVTHHVACAAQQHDAARQQSEGARQLLVDQLEHHKASLHPGMLHPNRCGQSLYVPLKTNIWKLHACEHSMGCCLCMGICMWQKRDVAYGPHQVLLVTRLQEAHTMLCTLLLPIMQAA